MIGRVPQPRLRLIILCAIIFVQCFAQEEYCNAEDEASCKKDTDLRLRISRAISQYVGCGNNSCDCFTPIIDNDLEIWSDGISRSSFELAKQRGVYYQVIDHKLYRQQKCLFTARCNGVEHFLLEIIEDLPDLDIVINVRDNPQSYKYAPPMPIFSFSKDVTQHRDILYPAWSFWEGGPALWPIEPRGLGRWDLKRDIITKSAREWPWEKKKDVTFFRGSRTSAERDPLILLSRRKPNLIDAAYTKNQAWKSDADTLGLSPAVDVRLEDHCQYKYLVNFRGVAASFRLRHLFLCRSLVFHVGEDWIEFFYPLLQPWVHYVPVQQDLSDFEELLEFMMDNDSVAHEIAERGFQFIWDHLNLDLVRCYWKHLLIKYATLQEWIPQLDPSLSPVI